jgi:hypothetical protein
MFEDIFWELNHASINHDDYYTTHTNLHLSTFFDKQENLFNIKNRLARTKLIKSTVANKSPISDNTLSNNLTILPIFNEAGLFNPALTNLKNFSLFATDSIIENLDDPYINTKTLNYIYRLGPKSPLSLASAAIMPISYTQVLDSFRPSYEENYLITDIVRPTLKDTDLPINVNSGLSTHLNTRISNPLKIRSSTKNAIVTYNAIQKVFRSRFDEGRSNTRLLDFSNSFTKHPFLTDLRIPYENILGKNKESFLKPNLYQASPKTNISALAPLNTATNIYFAELPFLTSTKSDSSRYL